MAGQNEFVAIKRVLKGVDEQRKLFVLARNNEIGIWTKQPQGYCRLLPETIADALVLTPYAPEIPTCITLGLISLDGQVEGFEDDHNWSGYPLSEMYIHKSDKAEVVDLAERRLSRSASWMKTGKVMARAEQMLRGLNRTGIPADYLYDGDWNLSCIATAIHDDLVDEGDRSIPEEIVRNILSDHRRDLPRPKIDKVVEGKLACKRRPVARKYKNN